MVTFRLLRISIDHCEANGRATTKVRLVSEAYHRAGGQICGQTCGLVGGQKKPSASLPSVGASQCGLDREYI